MNRLRSLWIGPRASLWFVLSLIRTCNAWLKGRLRVIAPAPDFAAIVKPALDPGVADNRGDLQVLGRMLDALGFVAKATADPQRHASLANATCNVYRELCRARPLIRAAPARRRACLLKRSLRKASAIATPKKRP
ncbi:MAG: hypothetical protein ABIQ90_07750 [Polaromonas sp.]